MSKNATATREGLDVLRQSPMMAHLLEAMEKGKDVGHFGRLTVTLVARHFLPEDELIRLLARQPGEDEMSARAMLMQVKERNYSPPSQRQIAEWQAQQEFPICPGDDPRACSVYGQLKFPPEVYDQIEEFWQDRAESRQAA